jgi:Protein of unknown function (DUF1573)
MRTTVLFLFLTSMLPVWASSLEFDSLLKEAHLSADAQSVNLDFHFENKTDKVVNIKRYDAGCSCTQVAIQDGKLKYEPGEKGTIRASYDMKLFSGVVDKSVMIFLDDDPQDAPSVVLTSRIHIPILVEAEPKTVKWLLGEKPEEKIVTITMNHTDPVRILRVSGPPDGIRHQLRTVEEGKKYELVLTPNDTTKPVLGIFRVETDCAIERHRVQQVFAVIRKEMAK